MTRTLLVAATSLIAASLMLSSAEACISCEYVPEVVRNHTTSNEGSSYRASRVHIARESRAARKSVAKYASQERAKKATKVAKAEKAEKTAKVAKVAKVEKPAKTEKVARAAKDVAKPVKVARVEPVAKKPELVAKKVEPKANAAQSENSSITLASGTLAAETTTKSEQPTGQEVVAKQTDCKKFFASVGMTLTVPCE